MPPWVQSFKLAASTATVSFGTHGVYSRAKHDYKEFKQLNVYFEKTEACRTTYVVLFETLTLRHLLRA